MNFDPSNGSTRNVDIRCQIPPSKYCFPCKLHHSLLYVGIIEFQSHRNAEKKKKGFCKNVTILK